MYGHGDSFPVQESVFCFTFFIIPLSHVCSSSNVSNKRRDVPSVYTTEVGFAGATTRLGTGSRSTPALKSSAAKSFAMRKQRK